MSNDVPGAPNIDARHVDMTSLGVEIAPTPSKYTFMSFKHLILVDTEILLEGDLSLPFSNNIKGSVQVVSRTPVSTIAEMEENRCLRLERIVTTSKTKEKALQDIEIQSKRNLVLKGLKSKSHSFKNNKFLQ